MLKIGVINNCENCGASFGQYNNDGSGDWAEYWCEIANPESKTNGLCQFCNPKSRYYNK